MTGSQSVRTSLGANRTPALALAAVAVTGCLPLPVLIPPIAASFGVGSGAGRLQTAPDETPRSFGPKVSQEIRVVARPLASFSSILDRSFDLGIGYKAQRFPYLSEDPDAPPLPWAHGPSFELRVFPWRHASNGTAVRLGIISHLDLLGLYVGREFRTAGGGDVGIEISLSQFLRGSPSAGSSGQATFLGTIWGEVGIGAALTGGAEVVAGQHFGYGMFSVTVQLPAAIGLALVPIPPFSK